MDTGSVLSEPVNYPHLRGFAKERSTSMTVLTPKPRMSQLENLEAKMANIEVSLSSSANPGRRRKGTSLGGSSTCLLTGNGTISARASPRPSETKELRSALQDREAVIQNLRIQLGLGKLPRPTGPPLDDNEKPVAEQKLTRLKIDAENKRIAIRNLKSALDKLDITDNIDIRIRQAELEYALGREELQLLSIVEEARALQTRLEKSKPESNSLYSIITSGINLSLHAVHATTGRWAATTKSESIGLFIEWALDGEGLYRGDRILEVNGKLVTCKTKEELQKMIGTSGKCQLIVIRKKSTAIPQQQEDNQRLQHRISYLEEQVRELQNAKEPSPIPPPLPSPSTHPIAATSSVAIPNGKMHNGKHSNGNGGIMNGNRSPVESITSTSSTMSSASSSNCNGNSTTVPQSASSTTNGHVTSINISSPSITTTTNTNKLSKTPTPATEKPLVYQRGNYVTTLLGGKPIELTGNLPAINSTGSTKSLATTTSTTSQSSVTNTPSGKTTSSASQNNQHNNNNNNQNNHHNHNNNHHSHHNHHHHHITKTLIHENGYLDRLNGSHTDTETSYMPSKSLSASKISINSDVTSSSQYHQHHYHQHHNQYNGSSSTGRKRFSDRGNLLRNGKYSSEVANQILQHQQHQQQQYQKNHINGINHNSTINNFVNGVNSNGNMHARSVEHLNYNGTERRKDLLRTEQMRKFGNDLRSVKSLDFESDTNDGPLNHHTVTNHHYHYSKRNVDYTSEPVAPRVRPTPPKKPLRLSLQRAQSLQTVELIPTNNSNSDIDKKRSLKRAHNITEKNNSDQQLIENLSPLHTASLGRHKHI